MNTYYVKETIDGMPTFEVPLPEILRRCVRGGAVKILSPNDYITDRQRRWYKGVCLRQLAESDENGESVGWWDTEVKRQCNGLAFLKKEIFFIDDGAGGRIGVGRLTTKGVGKRNMTLFIEEILSKAVANGWNISPPDPDLRSQ